MNPEAVFAALDALGIAYERYDHPPVFTGEDAAQHWAAIPARGVKNLFLRNKKGNRHYLVILPIEKEADLRRFVKAIGDDFEELCMILSPMKDAIVAGGGYPRDPSTMTRP